MNTRTRRRTEMYFYAQVIATDRPSNNSGIIIHCVLEKKRPKCILIFPLTRAALTIVPLVPWEGAPAARGPPDQLPKFLPCCFDVWTFSVGLNVATTTKKGRQLFWEKSALPEKQVHAQRKSWIRVGEKGPHPTLGLGPQTVNPALPITLWPFSWNLVHRFLNKLLQNDVNVSQLTWIMPRHYLVKLEMLIPHILPSVVTLLQNENTRSVMCVLYTSCNSPHTLAVIMWIQIWRM